MIAAAFALSLVLAGSQTPPPTHDQAVTCTGVLEFANLLMAQQASLRPSAENYENAEAARRLKNAADADRLAAALREGIAVERSGEMLEAWIQAHVEGAQATLDREPEPSHPRTNSRT